MKTRLLILLLFLYVGGNLVAQNATITGVVTDSETKDFLIGATVMLKGSNKGTITDANGQYTLFIPKGKQTIQFSFIGYQTQDFDVDLKSNEVKTLNLVMRPDNHMLKEVVISAQAKGQTAAIKSQFFFFNDTAATEIYTLSLHDALPILSKGYTCPLINM